MVERAVDLLLADLEQKKLGKAKRPRAAAKGRPGAISRQARREVFARDGERCGYVSEDGRRCDARAFTEVDHVEPRARGGSGESENLRVACRAHNRLAAEQAFGRELVEQQIHLRQKKRREHDDRYEKLYGALTGLGFKPKPTRAVLDRMRSGGGSVGWDAPLDQLLREAAQLLTPRIS